MNAQHTLRLWREELTPGQPCNKNQVLDGLIGDQSTQSHRTYLNHVPAHKAIIDRLGRFPHRNAVLDRGYMSYDPGFLSQPGWSS